MPFLLPALTAFLSDASILWLHQIRRHEYFSSEDDRAVYHIYYLILLAYTRIALLCLPLLFHSYTGTAIRCSSWYPVLYAGTLSAVIMHMLLLCFTNPASLEAILPFHPMGGSDSIDHLHELRRVWWVLIATLVSTACHVVMFWHVRSSAPQYYWPLREAQHRPSLYYTLRTGPGMELHLSDDNDLMHAMNDFVGEVRTRLRRAKTEWTARLDDFTARIIANSEHSNNTSNKETTLTPFRVMLLLFAYEDVLSNGKLDAIFEKDDGAALTFFVPQLLSFLLHGALYSSPQLETWILEKCSTHLEFAHRCFWFLRAWCLQAPARPRLPSRSNSENRLKHSPSSPPYLDEPSSPSYYLQDCNPTRKVAAPNGKQLLPEELQMIERLLERVKEGGNTAAYDMEHAHDETFPEIARQDSLSLAESSMDGGMMARDFVPGRSAASIEEAANRDLIPRRPPTNEPSLRHYQTLAAPRRHGFTPVTELVHSSNDAFDRTIHFMDSLLLIADELFGVPRENRKTVLRERLQQLECDLLPSNMIYVPLGQHRHCVWRIVASESLALSTKERVPCIVCLEVIDYDIHKRRRENGRRLPWGNLLARVQRREDVSGTPISRVHSSEDWTEAELVEAWRNTKRNPHRRSPFLHKVSATVQSNVQVVQDQLQLYRDRTFSEEAQYLNEPFVRHYSLNGSPQNAATVVEEPASIRDNHVTGPKNNRSFSRSDSGASIISMGQWSSPQGHESEEKGEKTDNTTLAGFKRRIETDFDRLEQGRLRYGSDSSEVEKINTSGLSSVANNHETKSNSKSTDKSASGPPVVFREDWKAKEKRIRDSSAYGSHPGWRLLPVLVKSNDDLRQEQLAAQLIYKMAVILAREKVSVWLYNYEILALTENGGIIEAIPDTISLDSLKKNDSRYTSLRGFFHSHFTEPEELADAKANFVESLAAYSIVCFVLQLKDRHNGNILLTNRGHLIHIDFGFFFLSSPGKNAGFESAPFKLTREFVELLDGPNSHLFRVYRELCVKTFIALRRHCMELILLVEMLKIGNEELKCFRGQPDLAIQEMRDRFRLDLNDRACREYVHSLVDDSIENWRTDWYDRYQRYFVGVL
ncbi:phosphatidylinositol 4-kinase A [Fistulifera solaris]|uniref:1-phosphatidylinositol 4-kinase n=1 Tax=Fistulifera solaris TaxID=1519565 RepID=A0A1Z5KN46_FISSO|nr:phosphatidylinositol 4-kinase A [Fistulifera solaris]|eukprot:GAX27535.1 phosphatidylinositol 4-kinase A [Fistulifera solaris]